MHQEARAHHELSPSRLNALAHCVKYRGRQIEADEDTAPGRGTLLHAAILTTAPMPEGMSPEDRETCEWARQAIAELARGDEIKYEYRMVLRRDDDPFADPLTEGTADAVIMREAGPMIIEVKTGQQRDYTPQCTIYALMAMQENDALAAEWSILYVDQQKIEHGHACWYDAWEFHHQLWERIHGSEGPTPCDYCSWCEDHITCPALNTRALAVAAAQWTDLAPFDASRMPTDPNMLAAAYELAGRLESWCGEVKKYVRNAMLAGAEVPGYEMRERRGARSVTDIPLACELSGMTQEEFLQFCGVDVTKLAQEWAEREAGKYVARGEKPPSMTQLKGKLFDEYFKEAMGREGSYQVVTRLK